MKGDKNTLHQIVRFLKYLIVVVLCFGITFFVCMMTFDNFEGINLLLMFVIPFLFAWGGADALKKYEAKKSKNNSCASLTKTIVNKGDTISEPSSAGEIPIEATKDIITSFEKQEKPDIMAIKTPSKYNTSFIEGLPISAKTKCTLFVDTNGFIIQARKARFKIAKHQIISVAVGTDKTIQKQYTTHNMSGALTGGLLFGHAGAMLGASSTFMAAKKIYFTVLYNNKNNEMKSLILEIPPFDRFTLKKDLKKFNLNVFNDEGEIEL